MSSFSSLVKQLYHFVHPSFQNLFLEYKVDLKPRYGHGNPPHPELNKAISENRDVYRDFLERSLKYSDNLQTIREAEVETGPVAPVWNNGYLPGLDMVGIYTMLAEIKPARYVEIGSGNSTKVAFKVKKEQHLNTRIISIDPHPRAEIDAISDEVIRQPFEKTGQACIRDLHENDILFVDNSHRILPNSDAMVFFLEVLPRLAKGVIVHIHDVYLPYDYPRFMCERIYTEQYGLAIWLLANPGKFNILLPNYYISKDKELSSVVSPLWEHENLRNAERHGGSFWFRINY